MWGIPRLGLKPVSPALAGGFLTTAPPWKSLDQMNLIDIYRAFQPEAAEYTFFSSAHGTFSKIEHILSHKASLGKFMKLKSYQASFLITML